MCSAPASRAMEAYSMEKDTHVQAAKKSSMKINKFNFSKASLVKHCNTFAALLRALFALRHFATF